MLKNLATVTLLCCLFFSNCNDPARISTGVIDEDELNVLLKDDFELTASTTTQDSVLTYTQNNLSTRYPCGNFVDPVFGLTSAQLFLQFRLPISPDIPDFEGATPDSIVLHLGLADSDRIYGDSTQVHEFEVFEVLEGMDNAQDYYSNKTFETDAMALGSFTTGPNYERTEDETKFYFPDTIILDTIFPEARAVLDISLAERLIAIDSAQAQSNTEFLQVLNGLNIRPKSNNEGMASFQFIQPASNNRITYYSGRLTLYYQKEGVPREYSWVVDPSFSTKVINFEHDYSGSPVEPALDNPTIGEESLYLQGFNGTNVKIDIGGWDFQDQIVVNKAELEVYAEISEEDELLYPLPEQMIVSEMQDDQLVLVRDFALAGQLSGDFSTSGGEIEEVSSGIYKYTVNISSHIQEIFDGEVSNEVFLRLFPKPYNVRRGVLFGPGNPDYPMKLKLTYTQL